MTRTPVTSSLIRSLGHEGDVLEVEFSSGRIYQYHGVSPEQAEALRTAPSIGQHFATHIRGAGFKQSAVGA